MSFRVRVFAIVVALPLAWGCGANDITDSSQIVFPAENVSYKAQVAPYMALSCSVTGCHDVATSSNFGIALTSWPDVVAGNVAVAHDTTCNLVQVMYGRLHTYPITANENQRNGIKVWVREGARNN